ncbi:pyridine nucleotide-disulfide oxidoreductase [Sporothrix brasiliensis 5110]|uniref:Pyridine nucleotide-disulfide oxidoreductase n=1 Tax=Sporothrix brasiliensis 5110 TaxID=1398154 RepID=A0A0C2EZL3_9PEZI|nr:pyridine nucleotide-disulfide oxidoreductase [Sporothrix brasiliensis 5110]KIH91969.1 pyridine nucleotide-disulfide oxidoreductase [Sporothrix brasiliensis 5110]
MADRKTVCIIGAGPSGLAAAKNLLWDRRARSKFRVTIVESQPRIGGLWPSSRSDNGGLVHPLMLANQSRHTVQLSGLAWEDDAPSFPRAWQIGAYLERYFQRYCRGPQEIGDLVVKLSRRVVRAEPIDSGWHVWTQATDTEGGDREVVDAGVFDYLVVASGYFGSPNVPEGLETMSTTTTTTTTTTVNSGSVPVVHSSAYRDLDTLFAGHPPTKDQKGKIVVAGGQFSGVEIAATIASHLSSAEHAPGAAIDTIPAASVHHVIQQPFWVFPLHTSPAPAANAPPFLPFDLPSYNIRKRPQPLADTQGHITAETARFVHGLFETALGTDQAEIHPALAIAKDSTVRDAPPMMAVSDTYLEHVRSGRITLSTGKLDAVTDTQAVVTDVSRSENVDNVAAVVLATGFSAATSLAFFPESVKQALHFDATDARQIVALAFNGTYHPAVANLAFVGFYRSPYWGVMEMQARLATALFVSDAASPPPSKDVASWVPATPQWPQLASALADDRSIERTLSLRADPERTSQFPMGDYLFLMHTFGEALGIPRRAADPADAALQTRDVALDVVTPAHYFDGDGDQGDENTGGGPTVDSLDTVKAIEHTAATVKAGLHDTRFVARAVFRSLQGTWKLDRTLTSRLPSHPSGRFVGTAEFRLRQRTKDGMSESEKLGEEDEDEFEYLYVEDGIFTALNGPSFQATRRYVWRYNARDDRMSVWFARTDDSSRADYLFHALEFSPSLMRKGWKATAGHLCIDDFYDVHYEFGVSGVNVTNWTLEYGVRGPKKDYTIFGTYRR